METNVVEWNHILQLLKLYLMLFRSGSGKSGSFGSGRQYSGSGRMSPGETLDGKNGQTLSSEQSLESITGGDNGADSSQPQKIKSTAPAHEIIEAMCSPNTGFSFIKSMS